MELVAGQQFRGFVIKRRLGGGMTGQVYQATAPDGTLVALKLCTDRSPSVRQYFINGELRLLRRAAGREHPHLARYLSSDTTGEPPSLAIRYQHGSLALNSFTAPRTPSAALAIAEQVGSALDYLHYSHPDHPVIHRDVKPDNIVMSGAGEALLIDLGAASYPGFRLEHERGMGTRQYMPPEQYEGDECPQTDQFALSMVVFQLLVGRTLLPGRTGPARKKLATLGNTGAAELRAALPRLPATATVLAQAIALDPLQRYETCAEFVYQLGLGLLRDGAALEKQRY